MPGTVNNILPTESLDQISKTWEAMQYRGKVQDELLALGYPGSECYIIAWRYRGYLAGEMRRGTHPASAAEVCKKRNEAYRDRVAEHEARIAQLGLPV